MKTKTKNYIIAACVIAFAAATNASHSSDFKIKAGCSKLVPTDKQCPKEKAPQQPDPSECKKDRQLLGEPWGSGSEPTGMKAAAAEELSPEMDGVYVQWKSKSIKCKKTQYRCNKGTQTTNGVQTPYTIQMVRSDNGALDTWVKTGACKGVNPPRQARRIILHKNNQLNSDNFVVA